MAQLLSQPLCRYIYIDYKIDLVVVTFGTADHYSLTSTGSFTTLGRIQMKRKTITFFVGWKLQDPKSSQKENSDASNRQVYLPPTAFC
jgi:hypothetical protein